MPPPSKQFPAVPKRAETEFVLFQWPNDLSEIAPADLRIVMKSSRGETAIAWSSAPKTGEMRSFYFDKVPLNDTVTILARTRNRGTGTPAVRDYLLWQHSPDTPAKATHSRGFLRDFLDVLDREAHEHE